MSAPQLSKITLGTVDNATMEVVDTSAMPAHVQPFGTGEMAIGHLGGPESGVGAVLYWTAADAGFVTGPKPSSEVSIILSGVLRLTPTGGEPVDIGAGEGYHLPAGWEGRVEAIEPVRKVYMMY